MSAAEGASRIGEDQAPSASSHERHDQIKNSSVAIEGHASIGEDKCSTDNIADNRGASIQAQENVKERQCLLAEFPFQEGQRFIRTRHNNLRCFPTCSPVHKSNTFCGSPVYVKASRKIHKHDDMKVYACFHLDRILKDLQTGKNVSEVSIAKSFFPARKYKQDDDSLYFIFMPDGKWTYSATLHEIDRHHFTVILTTSDDIVLETLNSPYFFVVPTWKVASAKRRIKTAAEKQEDGSQDGSAAEEEDNDGSSPRRESELPSSHGNDMKQMKMMRAMEAPPLINPHHPHAPVISTTAIYGPHPAEMTRHFPLSGYMAHMATPHVQLREFADPRMLVYNSSPVQHSGSSTPSGVMATPRPAAFMHGPMQASFQSTIFPTITPPLRARQLSVPVSYGTGPQAGAMVNLSSVSMMQSYSGSMQRPPLSVPYSMFPADGAASISQVYSAPAFAAPPMRTQSLPAPQLPMTINSLQRDKGSGKDGKQPLKRSPS